jgi:hypothetical protein
LCAQVCAEVASAIAGRVLSRLRPLQDPELRELRESELEPSEAMRQRSTCRLGFDHLLQSKTVTIMTAIMTTITTMTATGTEADQARSKRSRFITFDQAATKSWTSFSPPSELP